MSGSVKSRPDASRFDEMPSKKGSVTGMLVIAWHSRKYLILHTSLTGGSKWRADGPPFRVGTWGGRLRRLPKDCVFAMDLGLFRLVVLRPLLRGECSSPRGSVLRFQAWCWCSSQNKRAFSFVSGGSVRGSRIS
mmetsp:Transcript_29135/g.46749  ORF Transcript_29135/g.46749 Transcript_29135/m.46749 type:complete len:134 (-) Transcript_29135:898-1299(-)